MSPALTSLPLAHPTALAPMEGITDPLFRELLTTRPGVGLVCTEFVRITRDPCATHKLAAHVRKVQGVPLSVQVMGRELERLGTAAAAMSDAGADVVDLNLGCPTRTATVGGVGAALLREPAHVAEVMSVLRAHTSCLLSAKLRAGFDDAGQAVTLAKVVEDAGADFLVVHPRRGVDSFRGVADWRIVADVKRALRIPVFGNGDVWYAADALRLEAETGCDGVMVGRPALRNPWIFEQLDCLRRGVAPPRPDGSMLATWLRRVIERYREEYGRGSLGRMKELATYVGRAIPDGGTWRTSALRSATLEALTDRCDALSDRAASALDLGAEGALGLERSAQCHRALS